MPKASIARKEDLPNSFKSKEFADDGNKSSKIVRLDSLIKRLKKNRQKEHKGRLAIILTCIGFFVVSGIIISL